jgi:AraC family transcriptional regulator
LTLAGQELSAKDVKVIDIALKYGYETPESFSKAFSRFHDVTPLQAKQAGVNFKSYNRLTIKIIMEGGSVMDYRIEKKEAFSIIVKAKVIGENSSSEIPAFWGEYFSQELHKKVPGAIGMCGEMLSKGSEFKYGIGCCAEMVKEIPEGFEEWAIPANTWAIFKCVGAMPNAIQDM